MDDKDSGQVVSAVNCYFMCQVGFCMEQHPAAYISAGRSCVCPCFDSSSMVLRLYLCALCATQNETRPYEIHLNQKLHTSIDV